MVRWYTSIWDGIIFPILLILPSASYSYFLEKNRPLWSYIHPQLSSWMRQSIGHQCVSFFLIYFRSTYYDDTTRCRSPLACWTCSAKASLDHHLLGLLPFWLLYPQSSRSASSSPIFLTTVLLYSWSFHWRHCPLAIFQTKICPPSLPVAIISMSLKRWSI